MKIFKRIVLGLFIFLLLITGAVFVTISLYKKEMAAMLVEHLRTEYALHLEIGDADMSFFSNWPQASVQLKDVSVQSVVGTHTHEPVLKAGSISLSFNLEKLLHKQFSVKSVAIKNAEILLIKEEDGGRNFDFKKPVATTDTAKTELLQFDISKVLLKNIRFRFVNPIRKQDIDLKLVENTVRIRNAQDGMHLNLKGEVAFARLLFNEQKGAFLENTSAELDLNADWFFKSKMIVVYPGSHTVIDKARYDLNAFVQLGDSARKLSLRISSETLDYEKGAKLLNPKMRKVMSNFSVEKPFALSALVIARMDVKEDPILIVDVAVLNNAVKIGNSKIPYSKVNFNGKIVSLDSTHQRGASEYARITLRDIRGNIYNFPFTASVSIVNLDEPVIDIAAKLNIEAKKIDSRLIQDFVLDGKCLAAIRYQGPTSRLNKEEFLSSAMKLKADLYFTNFSYQEQKKPFVYTVNGKASVDNRDLLFERLALSTAAGDAVIKGKAENFVRYVLGYSNKVKATLVAHSELFDLNTFLPKKTDSARVAAAPSPEAKKASRQNINESDFEFDATFSAKKLLIRKVVATNAYVQLSHKNRLLTIRTLSVNTCDGRLTARGTVYDLSRIKAEIVMHDININRLFSEFEDFGQKAVQSRNVQGRISVNASFHTDLDDNMEVIGKSMEGQVKLKLKEGHLLNFEPIQSVSDYVFRHRDFKDVSFSELNETFSLRGYEMQIDELEIGSNVLNLYVTGTYNFKENSNINMLIPWHNLKRRGKDYVPKTYGEGMDSAKGLKLNYSGPTNKMKISLGHKDKI